MTNTDLWLAVAFIVFLIVIIGTAVWMGLRQGRHR